MSKETLISIAQRTGFSVSTVSRVLSGQAAKYRISEKTVALIAREAERCNYTPSLLAKGLRTSRTDTLGLLIPSIDNPYFAHIASIIVHEARAKGYKVILIDTSEDERNEREGVRSLLSRKVDGILIAPAGDDPAFLEATARQTPVVCIDRHFAKTSLPYVVTDNLRGGREATQHLIDRGHRRILCIQGVRHSVPSADRVRGYRQALEEFGAAYREDYVFEGQIDYKSGVTMAERLARSGSGVTAIVAAADILAIGAIKGLYNSGLLVPEDMSIIGFDDLEISQYLAPGLTTIRQQISLKGQRAVELLLEHIADPSLSKQEEILPLKLIERGSVKKLV